MYSNDYCDLKDKHLKDAPVFIQKTHFWTFLLSGRTERQTHLQRKAKHILDLFSLTPLSFLSLRF